MGELGVGRTGCLFQRSSSLANPLFERATTSLKHRSHRSQSASNHLFWPTENASDFGSGSPPKKHWRLQTRGTAPMSKKLKKSQEEPNTPPSPIGWFQIPASDRHRSAQRLPAPPWAPTWRGTPVPKAVDWSQAKRLRAVIRAVV